MGCWEVGRAGTYRSSSRVSTKGLRFCSHYRYPPVPFMIHWQRNADAVLTASLLKCRVWGRKKNFMH